MELNVHGRDFSLPIPNLVKSVTWSFQLARLAFLTAQDIDYLVVQLPCMVISLYGINETDTYQ